MFAIALTPMDFRPEYQRARQQAVRRLVGWPLIIVMVVILAGIFGWDYIQRAINPATTTVVTTAPGSVASDVSGRVILGPPKTAKSRRKVTLPRLVSDQLVVHLQAFAIRESDSFIFPSPGGGPIRRNLWVHRYWRPAVLKSGLERSLVAHALRHSQVALLIAQGEHRRRSPIA